MRRTPLLLGIAIVTATIGSLLVLVFQDGRPHFMSKSASKVELVNTNYYALSGSSDTFIMREWRVWSVEEEDIFASAKREFPKSKGWAQLSGKVDGTQWLQLSNPDGNVTVLFEDGNWRVHEARKVSKLDYYKAWLRSGGKVQLTAPNIRLGGASPKAGSPANSP